MIKIALIVSVISIANPGKAPNVDVATFYDSLQECHNRLDELKTEVNAIEITDNEKNRFLRLENREYHHRNYIFWSCKETNVN